MVSYHGEMRNTFEKVLTFGNCPLNSHAFKFDSGISRLCRGESTRRAKNKAGSVMKFPLDKGKTYAVKLGCVGEEFSG